MTEGDMRVGDSPCRGEEPPNLNFNMNGAYLCLWAGKVWGNMGYGNYKNNVSYRTKEFMKR